MTESTRKVRDCPIKVFLLIENRLVRESLSRLFRKRPDMQVVGDRSPAEAFGMADHACDILVLDDVETASLLNPAVAGERADPRPVGLVLIGMADDEERFLTAIRTGVSGYVLSDASANDVVAAVRSVARGEAACPPRLCLALFRSLARDARMVPAAARRAPNLRLTSRQRQLVSLVERGLTNKEIAGHLNLSEFTIKNHLHRIMKQVEVESRHDVAEAARASGFMAFAQDGPPRLSPAASPEYS